VKKEKLEHYADELARHADAPWVTPLFFALFVLDAFVMVIPADTLLGATVSMRKKHLKKWLIVALAGSAIGLAIAMLLAQTVFHDYFIKLTSEGGAYHKVQDVINHAKNYGYIELSIGVFTVVPSIIAGLAGVIVGLNPWVVWVIIVAAKWLKIVLTLWLLYTGSNVVKKWIRLYLKTSV